VRLDEAVCEQARLTRDARFDGRRAYAAVYLWRAAADGRAHA
jgi:hypothetical protein